MSGNHKLSQDYLSLPVSGLKVPLNYAHVIFRVRVPLCTFIITIPEICQIHIDYAFKEFADFP
jgi:hypothetical protein